MPFSKIRNYFGTSRLNINQDNQHVNMIGNKQTGRDAREGQVIEKQSTINGPPYSTHTLVILSEEFH